MRTTASVFKKNSLWSLPLNPLVMCGAKLRKTSRKWDVCDTSHCMVSKRGHNCIFSALTILDSALTS